MIWKLLIAISKKEYFFQLKSFIKKGIQLDFWKAHG